MKQDCSLPVPNALSCTWGLAPLRLVHLMTKKEEDCQEPHCTPRFNFSPWGADPVCRVCLSRGPARGGRSPGRPHLPRPRDHRLLGPRGQGETSRGCQESLNASAEGRGFFSLHGSPSWYPREDTGAGDTPGWGRARVL